MSHVFISYSKKNRTYARQLADHLLSLGFDIWIDDRIDFGEMWERTIFKAIDDCAAFIVIMTPESYASDWVLREIQYADRRHKPQFPVLLDGEDFPRYGPHQHVDVRGGVLPPDNFVERLEKAAPRSQNTGENVAPSAAAVSPTDRLPKIPIASATRLSGRAIAGVGAGMVALLIVTALFLSHPPSNGSQTNTPIMETATVRQGPTTQVAVVPTIRPTNAVTPSLATTPTIDQTSAAYAQATIYAQAATNIFATINAKSTNDALETFNAPTNTYLPSPTVTSTVSSTPTASSIPISLPTTLPAGYPINLQSIGGMDKLIELAKGEGSLNVIALPDDWANYKVIKASFKAKYGITLNDINPNSGSAEEIAAITSNTENNSTQPDVVDVGYTWGEQGKTANMFQPYKVATWNTIPDEIKDKDGFYWGGYFGTIAIEVNTDVVNNIPQDWNDLLKPEYKGQIAFGGDPLTANQAIFAIWAAAIANSGSPDNYIPGLAFFKQLYEAGNLVTTIATPNTIASGKTPIALRWDYNSLGNRDANKDVVNIKVVYPKSASIGGLYIQAISRNAPHPYAARLWQEFLYSDEGQLLWLEGYARPARFNDLLATGVIPSDLLNRLPSNSPKIYFPTIDQITNITMLIKSKWPEYVQASFTP